MSRVVCSDFCFFGVRTKHSLGFLIKLLSFGSVTNIYALKWLFGHSAHRIHPHSYCKWRLNPYQSIEVSLVNKMYSLFTRSFQSG